MNRKKGILLSFLVSVFLHLLLVFLGAKSVEILARKEAIRPSEKIEWVDLKNNYQIADISPPEKEERPDKAKFLGLYDSKTTQEQVAPTPLAPPQREKSETPDFENSGGQKKEKSNVGAMKSPSPKNFPEEGGGLNDALPEDFYPDYKVGAKTYLNVLRFPKVGYFVRLKKIFKTTFNPGPSIRPYLFSNQISKGQIEVILGVALDSSGGLSEIFVINSSGLPNYDQEAIRTIRASSPFSAPPRELLDPANELRMVWTFTVYI